ncbi:hypothetical protein HII30_21165 [Paenibacillus lemnae]|uniref:Uncharacterized protein n=1 Tax=Paenibacillus lemnae TaxID=1330551 RepID=A0A848MCP5_PAELE|nr:hypothetical protein [Paenibacillus lemnae]
MLVLLNIFFIVVLPIVYLLCAVIAKSDPRTPQTCFLQVKNAEFCCEKCRGHLPA